MFVTSDVSYDRPIQSMGKLKDSRRMSRKSSVVLVKIELSWSSSVRFVRSSLKGPSHKINLTSCQSTFFFPLKKPSPKSSSPAYHQFTGTGIHPTSPTSAL